MIVLSEREVDALLPMKTAITVVEKAMIGVSEGKTNLPLRSIMNVGGPNAMGMMPGAISEPSFYGIKLVSLFPDNAEAGYSSHQGAIILFEAKHGSPVAMMNAGLLTARRTAAASAVATRALARQDSAVLTIVGTGEQAEHHLDAMLAVRRLSEVRIAGRRAERAERFVQEARGRYPGISFSAETDIKVAVAGADIVCTVTSASDPILLGSWITPGTHLNIVGASIPSKREIDEDLVARSALFVDYRPSTFAQAGEVIGAIESGRITKEHVVAEIGEVLAAKHPGRSSQDEITLYRSLGVAAQDLACAARCLSAAKDDGLGIEADLA